MFISPSRIECVLAPVESDLYWVKYVVTVILKRHSMYAPSGETLVVVQ